MAKGHMRGNREIRKPKKEKSLVQEATPDSLSGRPLMQLRETAKRKK